MKRRKFLRFLGIGSVAAVVPKALWPEESQLPTDLNFTDPQLTIVIDDFAKRIIEPANISIADITKEALKIMHEKMTFLGTIDRSYDSSFAHTDARVGDTLKIRSPEKYGRSG